MAEMRVYLVEHDAAWAGIFEAERRLLEGLLGPWRQGSIEHVGSTAVAGLCAKPVVDVMVGIRSLGDTSALKQVLGQVGYQYSDWRADEEVWFCKPSFEHRTHHVHLVPHESPSWRDTVRFRDALGTVRSWRRRTPR